MREGVNTAIRDAKCRRCVHVMRDKQRGQWQCGSEAVSVWDLGAARAQGACGPEAKQFQLAEFD